MALLRTDRARHGRGARRARTRGTLSRICRTRGRRKMGTNQMGRQPPVKSGGVRRDRTGGVSDMTQATDNAYEDYKSTLEAALAQRDDELKASQTRLIVAMDDVVDAHRSHVEQVWENFNKRIA